MPLPSSCIYPSGIMYSSKKRKNEPGKESNSSSSIWVIKPARFNFLEVKRCRKYVRGNRDMLREFRANNFEDNAPAHIAKLLLSKSVMQESRI